MKWVSDGAAEAKRGDSEVGDFGVRRWRWEGRLAGAGRGAKDLTGFGGQQGEAR